jgi:ComF family protein
MPVPLSPQRLRERGYNQAGLLAHHLSRTLGVPVQHDGLLRRRHTDRLMHMDAAEREAHIRRAFAVNPACLKHIRRRHVAVVDDVLTSGATLNEVARTLWQAGAAEVSVWVVARTPLPEATRPDTRRQALASTDAWPDTELMA